MSRLNRQKGGSWSAAKETSLHPGVAVVALEPDPASVRPTTSTTSVRLLPNAIAVSVAESYSRF